jgi:hypothetical protein
MNQRLRNIREISVPLLFLHTDKHGCKQTRIIKNKIQDKSAFTKYP